MSPPPRKTQAIARPCPSVDLALLRDKTAMTEMGILFALHRDPSQSLSDVAARLDVTPQAVSNYVKRMAEDGLLTDDHRLTSQGIEDLHDRVEAVKRLADDLFEKVNVITETTALAGEAVAEGDEVGLVLEDGLLVAYPGRTSSSTGVAAADADAGEIVAVADLEGILDIRPGQVHLVRVPQGADPGELASFLDDRELDWGRVAGLGTEAKVLARDLDAGVLEFAPGEAAFEAAQLGLDVLLLATPDRVRDAISTLESRGEDALVPVRYRLHEMPG